jgi:PAS domain-containing protein
MLEASDTPARAEEKIDPVPLREGIILYRGGIVIDLDEETAAIFGYARHELLGKALRELLPEFEASTAWRHLSRHEITMAPLDASLDAVAPEVLLARRTAARSKDGVLFPVAIDQPRASVSDSLR